MALRNRELHARNDDDDVEDDDDDDARNVHVF